MTPLIETKIKNLPDKPGVYLMKNLEQQIIYVGKAKDLSKRVSQYFTRPQSGKVQAMVMHITDFETIITQSEKEALILEMNLIHEHYPRYNIMLKEGSHYPYIALRKGHDPYLKIMRNNQDKKYYYFGPYPSSRSAYRMISLLNKIFPLRKCNVLPKVACLYHHLGQCLAPCINDIPETVYNALADEITEFLKGNVKKQVALYEEKMLAASEALNFELAQEYKVILEDIQHVTQTQLVEMDDKVDRDIFAFAEREGYLSLAVFVFRQGVLLGKGSYVVEAFDDRDEQLHSLIAQYYRSKPIPQELVLNHRELLERLKSTMDIKFVFAEKGKLFELMKNVQENAIQTLDDHFLTARLDDNKLSLLESLGQTLQIPTPLHIEMFDNSHLQGSEAVGAMVTFINGEPVKKMYRQFHLPEALKQDDPGAMAYLITRRYTRLLEEKAPLPSLIVVDGGQNQLNASLKALQALNLTIPIVGLFKNERHQTKGLLTKDGEIFDFTQQPSLFFFLIRLQDEVHRFALAFHQRLRKQKTTKSIFDDIPGLGPTRLTTLQKRYPSLDLLKQASLEELCQLLPKNIALLLQAKLAKMSN
ncbi:MAG: excinuclease ABC subunit UvrC [Bacilli bacterium]